MNHLFFKHEFQVLYPSYVIFNSYGHDNWQLFVFYSNQPTKYFNPFLVLSLLTLIYFKEYPKLFLSTSNIIIYRALAFGKNLNLVKMTLSMSNWVSLFLFHHNVDFLLIIVILRLLILLKLALFQRGMPSWSHFSHSHRISN